MEIFYCIYRTDKTMLLFITATWQLFDIIKNQHTLTAFITV